jgi:aspartokinase/homoserine dehydrogenase 1
VNLVGVCGRTKAAFSAEGIDPAHYKEALEASTKQGGAAQMVDEILEMNIFNSVFVDCTASEEVAAQYERLLAANVAVVAANKVAASSAYDNYDRLKHLARERGVKFLFETNVGAGLPIIRTINDLCNSGDKILRIEAVLSGTLNYIFNTISAEVPFSETVKMAKAAGYSEPDPRVDLSGKDVIRKLVILAREAGYKINQEDVETHLFIPESFFQSSIEEFWEKLPSLDADFEQRRQQLAENDKVWRFVAKLENGRASVSLEEFSRDHSFYVLEGSNNVVLLTTERYKEYPMLIQGYGAGASVTAAGVFADIMSLG